MAPAMLASRNEPSYSGQCGVVFMRKHTNESVDDNDKIKPVFDLASNPNPIHQLNPGKGIDDSLLRFSDGGYVTFSLASYSRNQLDELKNRLISELEQVRILKDRIDSGQFENRPVHAVSELPVGRSGGDVPKKKKGRPGLKRSNPFVSDQHDPKRLAVPDPKSEKVLASMIRRCGQILLKLMKHKWGWVFNLPVDVVGLGLHDYHQIIKQPMDLGTVKTNLDKGYYRSPLDFASDVRLTFNNALTYNPKGQDAYFMAKQLLGMFEEMFGPAYKKFEAEQRKVSSFPGEMSSRKAKVEKPRVFNPETIVENVRRGPEPILIAKKLGSVKPEPALPPLVAEPPPSPPSPAPLPPVARVEGHLEVGALGKGKRNGKLPKPRAKDTNKRPMTIEEKAKLGMNLQELPPEKLGQMVQILRKRNGHLAQDGDEIELDIEVIDNETLWELDRFVTNYKKMVSKIKRQGFIQNQISTPPSSYKHPVSEMGSAEKKNKRSDAGEEDVDIGDNIPMANYPSVEIEKDAAAAASSGSSSSGSSGSSNDSSSSSDSGSGSSSGSDSDADSLQSPFVKSKEALGE